MNLTIHEQDALNRLLDLRLTIREVTLNGDTSLLAEFYNSDYYDLDSNEYDEHFTPKKKNQFGVAFIKLAMKNDLNCKQIQEGLVQIDYKLDEETNVRTLWVKDTDTFVQVDHLFI